MDRDDTPATFDQALAEFARVFSRIPGARGPAQDETRLCDPDEEKIMRLIESGKKRNLA